MSRNPPFQNLWKHSARSPLRYSGLCRSRSNTWSAGDCVIFQNHAVWATSGASSWFWKMFL